MACKRSPVRLRYSPRRAVRKSRLFRFRPSVLERPVRRAVDGKITGSPPVFSMYGGSSEPPFPYPAQWVGVLPAEITLHWLARNAAHQPFQCLRRAGDRAGRLSEVACKTLLISWLHFMTASARTPSPLWSIDRRVRIAPFRSRPEKLARSTFEEGYGRECGGRVFGTPGPARDDLSVGRLSPPLHSSSNLTAFWRTFEPAA